MLLGPQLADVVPYASALTLIGQLGLFLLVIEAGFEIDLPTLRQIGGRAIGASFCGMLLGAAPLAFGIARALHLSTRESLAVAASLAPCSTGIALSVLKRFRATNTPIGNLIIATAFAEDVIALTLLSELEVLSSHSSGVPFLWPVVTSLGFTLVVGACAVYIMPHVLSAWLLPRIPLRLVEPALLTLMFAIASGLVAACQAGNASPLLGAFLAGVSLCSMQSIGDVWRRQVKRPQAWLVRIFFSATVAFNVPIRLYGEPRVWRTALAFYAATLGKLLAGAFAEPLSAPAVCTLGWAMAGLGEFSFIVGTTARNQLQLMSGETYAAVTLAVLGTILVSPTLLGASLAWSARRAEAAMADAPKESHVFYKLDLKALSRWALVGDLLNVLHENEVEVVEFRLDHSGPFIVAEAYLKDLKIKAPPSPSPPEEPACGAAGSPPSPAAAAVTHPPELPQRLRELRLALLAVLVHDAQAHGEPAEEPAGEELREESTQTIDFSALRGLSLRRWVPFAADIPDDWDAEGGETANSLMRAEWLSFRPLPQQPAAPPPMTAIAEEALYRRAHSLDGGAVRVPVNTGLDRAMQAMLVHRAAAGEAAAARPTPRHEVVHYDSGDAASVNRLVAMAHAQATRDAAAAAERAHGLLGMVRRHRPRGLDDEGLQTHATEDSSRLRCPAPSAPEPRRGGEGDGAV